MKDSHPRQTDNRPAGDRAAEPSCATLDALAARRIDDWYDIERVLDGLAASPGPPHLPPHPLAPEVDLRVAFITFAYGIDGVSVEIAKYARSLEALKRDQGRVGEIHCLGGGFAPAADGVLDAGWKRKLIPNGNGWSKWGDGRLFARLFEESMPAYSPASQQVANAVWREALQFTQILCTYFADHKINLVIPVNVNSNPGNLALALATVFATEISGLPVLNSCHDFYWEAGKPASQRADGEPAGPRDHFFRNIGNRPFFAVFQRLLPWNGTNWFQLTINGLQYREIISTSGISRSRAMEIGTYLEASYLTPCLPARQAEIRQQLTYILGHGSRIVTTVPVNQFRGQLTQWMKNQQPLVCALEDEFGLDVMQPSTLWFLQPTRILPRKRIERDLQLISALMRYPPFALLFEENPQMLLFLHITGPVPAEHEAALARILDAYEHLAEEVPRPLRRRIFLALSAGKLAHSGAGPRGVQHLEVCDLYKMSDLILLPSQTEGRGLPIVEAGATGVPLVCSRYQPEAVFRSVVGENLPKGSQLRFIELPEDNWPSSFLQEVTDAVFLPGGWAARALHNRRVVARRYGMDVLQNSFIQAVEELFRHE